MYVFAALRLVLEFVYIQGVLFELIVAAVGTSIFRHEPVIAQIIGKINFHPPPECKFLDKFQEGVYMLELFVCLCAVGAATEVRHTWYMQGADANSLEIFRPVLVYSNAFLYSAAFLLSLQLRYAGWRSHTGVNYAQTEIANSQVQHATSTDSEEEILRRAMQASQLPQAASSANPAVVTPAQAASEAAAAARDDADMAQALEASRREAEEAAKRQAEEVRKKRQEQFRAQQQSGW